ncbi:hypothetical protein MJO29_012525, partial [Puccinia striiformis f. sp. tritici]
FIRALSQQQADHLRISQTGRRPGHKSTRIALDQPYKP